MSNELQIVKVRTLKRPWAICQFPTYLHNDPRCTEKAPHELSIRLPDCNSVGYFGIKMWYCETHLKYILYKLSDMASMSAVEVKNKP